jgi:MFS family permease
MIYALSGVAIASKSGSFEAYLYEAIGDKSAMTRFLGYLRAAESSGWVLGSLFGGIIVGSGSNYTYLVCIVLYIVVLSVALGSAISLSKQASEPQHDRETLISILRTGGSHVFRSGRILALITISMGIVGLSERHYFWQPYLAGRGLSTSRFGVIALLISVLGVLGGLLSGALVERLSKWLVICLGGVVSFVCFLLLVGFGNIWLVTPALLTTFLVSSLLGPVFTAMLNEGFPDEARATALSCVSWVGSIIRAIIRPGIGALADRSIIYPFALDVGVVGASMVGLLLFWRKTGGADQP